MNPLLGWIVTYAMAVLAAVLAWHILAWHILP
jgi:hypothetical protein